LNRLTKGLLCRRFWIGSGIDRLPPKMGCINSAITNRACLIRNGKPRRASRDGKKANGGAARKCSLWFSGSGELDFGNNGAAALVRSLMSADIPAVYKEYADIEHMTIVQAALDNVLKPAASGEERAARKAQAETNVATLAQSVDASKPDSPTQTDAPPQTDTLPAPLPPSPRRWLHQEC
jgi:hypothetical protein